MQHGAKVGLRAALDEVRVDVERDLRFGVTGQILHDLDIGPGQDWIGDVCVPEDVRRDVKVDRDLHARVTHGLAELLLTQHGFAALRALCRAGLAAHDVVPRIAIRCHAPRLAVAAADDIVAGCNALQVGETADEHGRDWHVTPGGCALELIRDDRLIVHPAQRAATCMMAYDYNNERISKFDSDEEAFFERNSDDYKTEIRSWADYYKAVDTDAKEQLSDDYGHFRIKTEATKVCDISVK